MDIKEDLVKYLQERIAFCEERAEYFNRTQQATERMMFMSRNDAYSNVLNEIKSIWDGYGFFLCSEAVVKAFPDIQCSRPFKSGLLNDNKNYYVAFLNPLEVEKYYQSITEDTDFWTRECVPGQMDESKITLVSIKKNGLFKEVYTKLNLSQEKNIAMVIWNLSERYGCTPIGLINRIA